MYISGKVVEIGKFALRRFFCSKAMAFEEMQNIPVHE